MVRNSAAPIKRKRAGACRRRPASGGSKDGSPEILPVVQVTQPVKIGDDVDGISGATWTSTSVATAVKRALAVYKEFITA
jgi:hypothetical protein